MFNIDIVIGCYVSMTVKHDGTVIAVIVIGLAV